MRLTTTLGLAFVLTLVAGCKAQPGATVKPAARASDPVKSAPAITNNPAMIPAAIHPATQGDRLIDISCSQGATIMTAHSLISV